MSTIEFNTEDVVKVAKALLDFGVNYEDYGDNAPYYGFECQCCDGDATQVKEEFEHKLDCPILIAKDLLTNL